MDCKEFKEYIDDYFLDPDFDWKLRYKIEDHLIKCEQCQKIYSLSGLVASKKVMSVPIKKIQLGMLNEKAELYLTDGNYKEAIKCLQEASKLNPTDKIIRTKLDELLKKYKTDSAEILFRIYKDDELFREIPVITEDFSSSTDLTDPGHYSLIDHRGQIHWQWEKKYTNSQMKGPSLTKLHSPFRPKITKIQILTKESEEFKNFNIRLEQKEYRTVLSIVRIKN
jgi:tetratricopeptide (TPR) repeat protein